MFTRRGRRPVRRRQRAPARTADIAHLRHAHRPPLPGRCRMPDHALLALQGPQAVDALARLAPGVETLRLHDRRRAARSPASTASSRARGYTGEDGFEISVPADDAEALAKRAARRSPRSSPPAWARATRCGWKPGLCLYGHDIDDHHHAGRGRRSTWAIQKVRRPGGARAGGYPGAADDRSASSASGARDASASAWSALERVPVREGTPLRRRRRAASSATSPAARSARRVDQPVAMAYVAADHAAPGTRVSCRSCAASACRCDVERHALRRRTATSAADRHPRSIQEHSHDHHVHHRPRMDQASTTTTPPPSASRCTRRTRSATWSSSTCPKSARRFKQGRSRRRGRVGQGRGRPLHAGRGRGRRGQRGAARRPVARQQRPDGQRLVLQGAASATPASSTR